MNTPLTSVTSTNSREGHVLVVEDVDTTRQRLVDTLRRNGFRVEEAHDGHEALQKVSARRFDAILLDLVLPHVDGWQFRETQLRHPELATIPTIVVTVRPLREADRYALRADHVVHKPFEDGDLLAAVRRACGTKTQPAPVATAADPNQLFWSRRGEVACWQHAPETESQRWHEERWTALGDGSGKRGFAYRCQHCPGADGPIDHGRRETGRGPLPRLD